MQTDLLDHTSRSLIQPELICSVLPAQPCLREEKIRSSLYEIYCSEQRIHSAKSCSLTPNFTLCAVWKSLGLNQGIKLDS